MVEKTRTKLRNCQRFYEDAQLHISTQPLSLKELHTTPQQKAKRQALCPPVETENYYAKFETRMLRTGEDPSVYKWELEQLLEKADPKLAVEAKSALLSRQFMRDLPSSIQGKLFAHNPTPILIKRDATFCPTLSIDRRPHTSASASTHKQTADMDQLVGLMTELVTRQKALEDQVATSQQLCRSNEAKRTSTTESYVFLMWKTRPHCSRVSQFKPMPRPFQRAMLRMREDGHFARECGNYAPLNFQGPSRGTTGR
jgi:hypothetical protein